MRLRATNTETALKSKPRTGTRAAVSKAHRTAYTPNSSEKAPPTRRLTRHEGMVQAVGSPTGK